MNEQTSRRGASIIDREPPNAAATSSARLMTRLYAVSGAGVSLRGLPNAAQRRMIDPHKPAIWRMPSDTLAPGAPADRSRPPRGLYPRDRRFFGSAKRWQERAVTGMSDAALAEALAGELGIFGGSGGPAALTLRCLCYSSRWVPNPPLLSPAINPNGSQAASEKK